MDVYGSTHTGFEDILVAKCVRHSSSSDCVIDCTSGWPNISIFPPPSKLREKSVISSKAPFEKPSNPVIAREKAEQPAKPNTWEGIWNIVNSGVTHSLLKPGPVGGKEGVFGHMLWKRNAFRFIRGSYDNSSASPLTLRQKEHLCFWRALYSRWISHFLQNLPERSSFPLQRHLLLHSLQQ